MFEQFPILLLPIYIAFRIGEEITKWVLRSRFKLLRPQPLTVVVTADSASIKAVIHREIQALVRSLKSGAYLPRKSQ